MAGGLELGQLLGSHPSQTTLRLCDIGGVARDMSGTGVQSDTELLAVTRIQKQCWSICYHILCRHYRHMSAAIWSLIRGLHCDPKHIICAEVQDRIQFWGNLKKKKTKRQKKVVMKTFSQCSVVSTFFIKSFLLYKRLNSKLRESKVTFWRKLSYSNVTEVRNNHRSLS